VTEVEKQQISKSIKLLTIDINIAMLIFVSFTMMSLIHMWAITG